MTGLLTGALWYAGGMAVTVVVWAAEVAKDGFKDTSWIAPVILALGTVLTGIASKLPAVIRAWKEPPKQPRQRRRTAKRKADGEESREDN